MSAEQSAAAIVPQAGGIPRVDSDRLWRHLMELADITEPATPWTRRAFTAEHAAGRQWLAARFLEAGLSVRVDAAGNLIGRREGSDPAAGTLMVGSHSDTVRGGGRFDGIAGVIAGLEIAAALQASGRQLRHAFEVVDFLAEEPNPYGVSCIGSRGMSGQLTAAMLERTDAAGVPLRQRLVEAGAAAAVGVVGTTPVDAYRTDLAAFLELHIEQGPVLEAEGLDLGLVTAIAGIRRWHYVFAGQAAHAGTTPYPLRRDALQAAAQFVGEVPLAVEALRSAPSTPESPSAESAAPSEASMPLLIATVGQLEIAPNAANVVPGEARLTLDLRSDDETLLEQAAQRLQTLAKACAAKQRVELQAAHEQSASAPAHCHRGLLDVLGAAARSQELRCRELVSGAGHDAAFLSRVAPTAMLFVPSRDGLSHTSTEWTDPKQLERGVRVLLAALLQLEAGGV